MFITTCYGPVRSATRHLYITEENTINAVPCDTKFLIHDAFSAEKDARASMSELRQLLEMSPTEARNYEVVHPDTYFSVNIIRPKKGVRRGYVVLSGVRLSGVIFTLNKGDCFSVTGAWKTADAAERHAAEHRALTVKCFLANQETLEVKNARLDQFPLEIQRLVEQYRDADNARPSPTT